MTAIASNARRFMVNADVWSARGPYLTGLHSPTC
jgi:hypothetical protein